MTSTLHVTWYYVQKASGKLLLVQKNACKLTQLQAQASNIFQKVLFIIHAAIVLSLLGSVTSYGLVRHINANNGQIVGAT